MYEPRGGNLESEYSESEFEDTGIQIQDSSVSESGFETDSLIGSDTIVDYTDDSGTDVPPPVREEKKVSWRNESPIRGFSESRKWMKNKASEWSNKVLPANRSETIRSPSGTVRTSRRKLRTVSLKAISKTFRRLVYQITTFIVQALKLRWVFTILGFFFRIIRRSLLWILAFSCILFAISAALWTNDLYTYGLGTLPQRVAVGWNMYSGLHAQSELATLVTGFEPYWELPILLQNVEETAEGISKAVGETIIERRISGPIVSVCSEITKIADTTRLSAEKFYQNLTSQELVYPPNDKLVKYLNKFDKFNDEDLFDSDKDVAVDIDSLVKDWVKTKLWGVPKLTRKEKHRDVFVGYRRYLEILGAKVNTLKNEAYSLPGSLKDLENNLSKLKDLLAEQAFADDRVGDTTRSWREISLGLKIPRPYGSSTARSSINLPPVQVLDKLKVTSTEFIQTCYSSREMLHIIREHVLDLDREIAEVEAGFKDDVQLQTWRLVFNEPLLASLSEADKISSRFKTRSEIRKRE